MHFKLTAGHTLLELMVTLTIIAIMLLFAFTSFNNATNIQSAKNAANQAGYAIKKARYYSKTNGVITKLVFQEDENKYEITANDLYITQNSNFDATSGILPDGIIIKENTCGDFYFYIDGTPLTQADTDITQLSSDCSITVGFPNGPVERVIIKGNSGNIAYD